MLGAPGAVGRRGRRHDERRGQVPRGRADGAGGRAGVCHPAWLTHPRCPAGRLRGAGGRARGGAAVGRAAGRTGPQRAAAGRADRDARDHAGGAARLRARDHGAGPAQVDVFERVFRELLGPGRAGRIAAARGDRPAAEHGGRVGRTGGRSRRRI